MMKRQNTRWYAYIVAGLVVSLLAGAGMIQAQEIDEVKQFPSPFLLTAAGQSPDLLMAKIVAEREQLDFTYKALAASEDLEGMHKHEEHTFCLDNITRLREHKRYGFCVRST